MNFTKSGWLLLLLILLVSFSCDDKSDANTSIIGKWLLTEQLLDPGNGSGTFQPVASTQTIEFSKNGTFISNENMCISTTGSSKTGTYSLDDQSISPDNCSYSSFKIHFELENENLIISYPCIEPCKSKYTKISND